MRRRAQEAGNLNSSPQQTVNTEGSDIEIEPVSPDIVYVPAYDPWVVYGGPIVAWPGWYQYPGIWYGGLYPSYGVGFGIGFYGGYGWGWRHWGSDWHHRSITYDHDRYDPGAARFITGTTTTQAEKRAARLAATTADLAATGAEIVPATTRRIGHPARTPRAKRRIQPSRSNGQAL